jgi:hypothetical protein
MYILIALCLILSACASAVMETIHCCLSTSIFKKYVGNYFVDPSISWLNKYKNHDPAQGEAFWGSTTIFVMFTDLWHAMKHLFLVFLFGSMIPLGFTFHWWIPLLMYPTFTLLFQVFYWWFNKK